MADNGSRRWCFTINNPCKDDNPEVLPYKYLVWQLERGDSGTRHFQGAVQLSGVFRLAALKVLLPRAHWEKMQAKGLEAFEYASKEEGRLEGPWTRGEPPRPGTRTDWNALKARIDGGASDVELSQEYFQIFLRCARGIRDYRLVNSKPRNKRPEIVIFWGESRTGKSLLARDAFPGAFWKPKNAWWDKYFMQDTVVFDEFYSWVSFDDILRILDWYPLIVEIKGTAVELFANRFVFTSNQDPRDWYRKLPEFRREAFFERILEFGVVFHFTRKNGMVLDMKNLLPERVVHVPYIHAGQYFEDL